MPFRHTYGMRSEMKDINVLNLEGPAMRCRYKKDPNDGKIITFAELTERYQQSFSRMGFPDFGDSGCTPHPAGLG
eukprot:962311-Karenia_brevis.AAC.1